MNLSICNYPFIKGTLINKDKMNPTKILTIKLNGFLYKTIQVAIKTIEYKIPLKSKYHIPTLKQLINNMNIIKLLIIIDNLLSLLLYQHMNASSGDTKVNPYQVTI